MKLSDGTSFAIVDLEAINHSEMNSDIDSSPIDHSQNAPAIPPLPLSMSNTQTQPDIGIKSETHDQIAQVWACGLRIASKVYVWHVIWSFSMHAQHEKQRLPVLLNDAKVSKKKREDTRSM